MTFRTLFLASAALFCTLAATARGETVLNVRLGWDGLVHADRWNPVFVTLSDPRNRSVVLEFRTPHDTFYGMRVRQVMAIGPQPQTFPLYVPMRYFFGDDVAVVVRDATTGKKLAEATGKPLELLGRAKNTEPGHHLVGISGRPTGLTSVTGALKNARLQSGYLDPFELPSVPIGYDCLDVLVLSSPDLTVISDDQQQAIVDWVRGGGRVILWPGDRTVPKKSPLVDLLPCRIGTTRTIQLSAEQLAAAGLSQRFNTLPARELQKATVDAEEVALLGVEDAKAYRRRVGLGLVLVSPVDLSQFQFKSSQDTWRLWKPVLQDMIYKLPEDGVTVPEDPRYAGQLDESSQREVAAVRQIADVLGNVPGAGRFGFGYVAGVLIGMMLVVGPVDWFVLKKLGRQPWTWATTTGWIALVTLAAVYAGNIFKSGELHFRSFQVVDQVDGFTVARNDLVGLYSPRTRRYEVDTDLSSWWQPASPGDDYYGGYRRNTGSEISFRQSYRGNNPDPAMVNVWNLRFVKGRAMSPAPAMVDAQLTVSIDPKLSPQKRRITGTITNLTGRPLKHLAIRCKFGWYFLPADGTDAARIAPEQTLKIDGVIEPNPPPPKRGAQDPMYGRGMPYYYNNQPLDRSRLWEVGGGLAPRRTAWLEHWVAEREDLACVYGEFEDPEPVVGLKGETPKESHWKVMRALVTLGPKAD
ncbi:MAG TPA: hypothetical protein VFB66_18760 [Tepidisphaeraceae bacterium]|nr:hypothetical protein [Tepidisphaeraceae bacterium]